MKFKSIEIKNFRNYKKINLDLTNKNIIFGRNDFGKTNFLHALRFLFDPKVRNKGFEETDYYQRDTEKIISILIELELNEDNDDTEFIRAHVGGAIEFSEDGEFYIQLEAKYRIDKQLGVPILKWGSSLEELKEIPSSTIYSDLDSIFEVVYIHPNISPDELFKKHRKLLYKDTDTSKSEEIRKALDELNNVISMDSRVTELKNLLTKYYRDIRHEDIEITLKSEHEINGVFNQLVPYILNSKDQDKYYPTSGDGRRKILAYALTNLIEEKKREEREAKRIPIFLIEEVENSLHPSMQQMISRNIFQVNKDLYKYLFVTTHSEHMLMYMDEVNLVRIHKDLNDDYKSASKFYVVPDEFKKTRKTFNEVLSQAFFYDKVLLVEGMSEKILFDAIYEKIAEGHIEVIGLLEKILILSVEGIGFQKYVELLHELGIEVFVKTDNDIKKVNGENYVSLLGINRCKKLYNYYINVNNIESEKENIKETEDYSKQRIKNDIKRRVYNRNKESIEIWEKFNIYLSEIELEEDLSKVLNVNGLLSSNFIDEKDFIEFLQEQKKINMNQFVNDYLDYEMAKVIYQSNEFKCLRDLLGFVVNE